VHRLLAAPVRRLESRIVLPQLQPVTQMVAAQLTSSMLEPDSLRRSGTSRSGIVTGPLAPVQIFAHQSDPGEMGVNSPANMSSGLMIGNARRLTTKTRGQSAGT